MDKMNVNVTVEIEFKGDRCDGNCDFYLAAPEEGFAPSSTCLLFQRDLLYTKRTIHGWASSNRAPECILLTHNNAKKHISRRQAVTKKGERNV